MSCYEALASSYDALTEDVGYEKRADFLEKLFRRSRIPVRVVLDLACGTGTMTWLLTGRGYELIGVDGSEEMLAAAMSKTGSVQGVPPIFLHQSMPKLDLYGTVDAAIIMGTGHQSPAIVAGGRAIAKAAGKRHGFKAHSPRVEALAFGAYNKAFAPNRTEVDWLSASDNNVDAYIADPLCGQKASIGLFYEMLGGIRFISTPKNIASMNRNTPILFISGDKDPVGEMGKGVKRAYEAFRRAGVRDVELKLYKGLRHEILNEDCRAVVYNDLWSWIEKHL